MTDEHYGYRHSKAHFAGHGTTRHSAGQYVDLGDRTIHSNTVEDYFSTFNWGMKGVYQHCGEKHPFTDIWAEFDFRYCNRQANGVNDADRSVRALEGIMGEGLTYQTVGRAVA